MNWIFNQLIAVHVDAVTGIAVVTLLFMMLQTEHERCDRVRAGWTEVRRATLKVTSAIQRAEQRRASPDAQQYLEDAQDLLNQLFAAILLGGKGSLKREYMKRLNDQKNLSNNLLHFLPVFRELDIKTEKKFTAWRLRVL